MVSEKREAIDGWMGRLQIFTPNVPVDMAMFEKQARLQSWFQRV